MRDFGRAEDGIRAAIPGCMTTRHRVLSVSFLAAASTAMAGCGVGAEDPEAALETAAAGSCGAQTILFAGACRGAAWIDTNLAPGSLPFVGASALDGAAPGTGIIVYERVDASHTRATVLSTALPLPAGNHPHPTRGGYKIEQIRDLTISEDQAHHFFFQRTDKAPVFLIEQDQWAIVPGDWRAVEVLPDHTATYLEKDGAGQSLGFLGQSWLAVTASVSELMAESPLDVKGTSSNPYQTATAIQVVQWYPTPWDCPPGFQYDCNIVAVLVQDGGYIDENGDLVVEAHTEDTIVCGCWNGNALYVGNGW